MGRSRAPTGAKPVVPCSKCGLPREIGAYCKPCERKREADRLKRRIEKNPNYRHEKKMRKRQRKGLGIPKVNPPERLPAKEYVLKKCSRCGIDKSPDCFNLDKRAKDITLSSKCKDCSTVTAREYYRRKVTEKGNIVKPRFTVEELTKPITGTKVCKYCKQEKDVQHFQTNKRHHKTFDIEILYKSSICYACEWERMTPQRRAKDLLLAKERRQKDPEKYRIYSRLSRRKIDPKILNERVVRYQKRMSDTMDDPYIRELIKDSAKREGIRLKAADIPPELIQLKRKQLKLIRDAKQIQKSECN